MGITMCLVAVCCAWSAEGDEDEHKVARETLCYTTLSDGKAFSVRTSLLRSPERRQAVRVWAVADPEGKAFYKGAAAWETPLATLDHAPGASYYVLLKATRDHIFVFFLWNGRHCTINNDSGQMIKEGAGDEALLEYDELVPLKVVVVGPQTGRMMTEQEIEELEKQEAREREGAGSKK